MYGLNQRGFSVAYGEPNDWIVDQCCAAGRRIDKRRLSEWHRKGLIPEPKTVSLGRGKGSDSIYPVGTLRQVRVCFDLMKYFKRNTEAVGWALWYAGFTVGDRFWRAPFEGAFRWLTLIHKWAADKSDPEDDLPSLSDEADCEIRKIAGLSRGPDPMGFSRRILKRDGVAELMSTAMSVAIGAYERSDDASENQLANSLGRLVGTLAADKKKARPAPNILEVDGRTVAQNLNEISKVFRSRSLKSNLSASEAMELRDEFKFLLTAFRGVLCSDPSYFSRTTKLLNGLIKMESRFSGPMALIVWSIARQVPGWLDNLGMLRCDIQAHLRQFNPE